jgi:hypothetical protein
MIAEARGGSNELKQKFEQCYAKCTVQLLTTQTVAEIVARYFDSLNSD